MTLRKTVQPAHDVLQQQTFRQLQTLPNVGPATAGHLIRLGVTSLDDLGTRDPRALYDGLTRLDGIAHDPCVLDVFAAAIHACRNPAEAIPWWESSRARKDGVVTAGSAAAGPTPRSVR